MKTSLEKDRSYVKWHTHRSLSWSMGLGYHWFTNRYFPALERLANTAYKKDYELLSNSYCLIGNIHFVNSCPRAAIKAYETSLKFNPAHTKALQNLGNRYEEIGQYRKAVHFLNKYLEFEPEDEFAIDDRDYALFRIDHHTPPLYEKNDICWHAREKLAQDKPNASLRLLNKKLTIKARLIRACSYAAMGDSENYFDQWHRIVSLKSPIEMTFADWFYIEDSVWNSSVFWEILLICAKQNRFVGSSVMPYFESHWDLDTKKSNSRCPSKESKALRSRRNKSNGLLFQYHIARTNQDLKLATKLANRCPEWPEIKELKDKMQSKVDRKKELLQEKKRQRAIEKTKKSLQKGRFVTAGE